MGRNVEEQISLNEVSKYDQEDDVAEGELLEERLSASAPKSPIQNSSRPTSMVVKKAHALIPPHLIAEAISSLHGLDLRWSGPITPNEMQYVQQYVFAKYPEYRNGLVEEAEKIDIYGLCINGESSEPKHSPKNWGAGSRERELSAPSLWNKGGSSPSDLDRTQLDPSRLLDILTKKSSFQGNFISIPEIQVRNRALQQCGLTEDEYLVLFTPTSKEAMVMVGESYPFFRGNYYMTVLNEEQQQDCALREFASNKESKVVAAPESWLDLRIKGSQLSQYFRRKCKHSPKGLFSYPACVNGTNYSMHWISEAHRNSWHVLLDATALDSGKDRLALALHRPDFVVCVVDNKHGQPSKITCLLVRRSSFDTMMAPSP